MGSRYFRLEIKLGNDAMRTGEDIQRALQSIAVNYPRLGGLEADECDEGLVFDYNGNQVGVWRKDER